MDEKSYQIIKTFFSNLKKETEEVTFFFHPDNSDGEIDISYNDNDDFDTSLYLPELKNVMAENNLDTYNAAKYHIFRNHISTTLKELQKKKLFSQHTLFIYSQHIDGEKEIILRIQSKKNKPLFPNSQQYSFDLSMLNQNNGKSKWWKVITPTWQEDRPYQNLELSQNDRDNFDFYSWCGESLLNKGIKNLQLISERKISKLWDYESSELSEVFSDRFCQMLSQMQVTNIEYYPITVTCKATGETSDSYYRLANIVGLVEGISFYDKSDYKKGIETIINSNRVYKKINAKIKAEKKILDSIDKKIVRCKDCLQIFIVDNDIKQACDVNAITGIQFEEIELIE